MFVSILDVCPNFIFLSSFQLISVFLGLALAEPDFAARDLFQQARAANARLEPRYASSQQLLRRARQAGAQEFGDPRDYALQESAQYNRQQLLRRSRQAAPQGDRRFADFDFQNEAGGFGFPQGAPPQEAPKQQRPRRFKFKRPEEQQQRVSKAWEFS